MAYTKHEWVTGEIITATNLNHMEDGIASKLDASAVVNSQEADTPGTALDAMQGNPDVPGSLAAQIKEAGESSKAIVLTQAQYDALSDEEKDSDNVYYISDAPFESSNVVPLTRAEYDALSDATKMDGRFYYITDESEVAKSLVVQTNVNSTETVPSSAVVYNALKAINDMLTVSNVPVTVYQSSYVDSRTNVWCKTYGKMYIVTGYVFCVEEMPSNTVFAKADINSRDNEFVSSNSSGSLPTRISMRQNGNILTEYKMEKNHWYSFSIVGMIA